MKIEPTSFRDPSGRVYDLGGRIIRAVGKSGSDDLTSFFESKLIKQMLASGAVVNTKMLDRDEVAVLSRSFSVGNFHTSPIILEHERIFRSYPYEWPHEMLLAAGELTLSIAETLADEGLGLKDATPYNVLFRGTTPVFVDVLSMEKRDVHDPTWIAYSQFVRTFLLPLLANKYFGVSLGDVFISKRDGLEPGDVYRYLSPIKRLFPRNISLVTMPTLLSGAAGGSDSGLYKKRHVKNAEKALFILRSQFKGLRRQLKRFDSGKSARSKWTSYMGEDGVHSTEYYSAKETAVERMLNLCKPAQVLDVGCNTGHFSMIAAKQGRSVVSIDSDEAVVGEVWRKAKCNRLNILPLVADITRPSPAIGWRNRECPSLLDRLEGQFDVVMMLAVIHHMLVTERIPLSEIVDLASGLTKRYLIIEYVDRNDRMFQRIARGRDELHEDLSKSVFEDVCKTRFVIVEHERLNTENRWLYLLEKRDNG